MTTSGAQRLDDIARADRERSRPQDWRLAPAALTVWCICGVALGNPGAQAWFAAGCVIGALTCGFLQWWHERSRAPRSDERHRSRDRLASLLAGLIALTCAIGSVGALAANWYLETRVPLAVEQAIGRGGLHVEMTVTALVDPAVTDTDPSGSAPPGFGARFRASLTAITNSDGTRMAVSAPLLVYGQIAAETPPDPGTTLIAEGRFKEAAPTLRVAAVLLLSDPARVAAGASGVLGATATIRQSFLQVTEQLPGDGAALLAGLAVGDDRGASDELVAAMKVTSLSHLTAVSGSNCALIVGLVLLTGRALSMRRAVRLSLAGLVLALFVTLVTPQGSVLRASAMAFFVLGAEGVGRRTRAGPTLCIAVIGLIVSDPGLALDLGFALSVAATLGLLIGAGPVADTLASFMPRWLALALAAPTAAQLACGPILVLIEGGIPTYGVLANLLAAPAAPIATVIGLLACVLAPLTPGLALMIAGIAWAPAAWIAALATVISTWPFATVPWEEGPGGAVALAIPTVVVAWLVIAATTSKSARRVRRIRRVGAGLVVLCVIGVVGGWAGSILHRSLVFPRDWRYASCDVGQGDATVVQTASGTALIDTGADAALVSTCLRDLGVDRIRILVITHFDSDHSGAVMNVLDRVDAVLLPDTAEAREDQLTAQMTSRGISVQFLAAGDAFELGDTTWRVLAPFRTASGGPSLQSGNEASLTVRVDSAPTCAASCASLVALGDLDERAQRRVLADSPPGEADVVKVSHHGSKDQAAELYAQIDARIALVSVGADNTYGHPTPEALQMLAERGSRIVRTDETGTVVIRGDRASGFTLASP